MLEIDQERRLIYVHVIDVGSEPRRRPGFYRQIAQMERLLVSTFERDADWRPVTAKRGIAHDSRTGHRRGRC